MMPRMRPTVHSAAAALSSAVRVLESGRSEVRRYTMQVTSSTEFARVKRASGVAPSGWVGDYVETRLPARLTMK